MISANAAAEQVCSFPTFSNVSVLRRSSAFWCSTASSGVQVPWSWWLEPTVARPAHQRLISLETEPSLDKAPAADQGSSPGPGRAGFALAENALAGNLSLYQCKPETGCCLVCGDVNGVHELATGQLGSAVSGRRAERRIFPHPYGSAEC